MFNRIIAPFTDDQIEILNKTQNGLMPEQIKAAEFLSGLNKDTSQISDDPEEEQKIREAISHVAYHPYTCCGSDNEGNHCNRSKHDDGILIATRDGWVCPCGKYTQDLAYPLIYEKK